MAAPTSTTGRGARAATVEPSRTPQGHVAHKVAQIAPAERLLTIQACSFVAARAEGDGNLEVFYDRIEAIMGLAGLILAARTRH